jgi:hypothetical protein
MGEAVGSSRGEYQGTWPLLAAEAERAPRAKYLSRILHRVNEVISVLSRCAQSGITGTAPPPSQSALLIAFVVEVISATKAISGDNLFPTSKTLGKSSSGTWSIVALVGIQRIGTRMTMLDSKGANPVGPSAVRDQPPVPRSLRRPESGGARRTAAIGPITLPSQSRRFRTCLRASPGLPVHRHVYLSCRSRFRARATDPSSPVRFGEGVRLAPPWSSSEMGERIPSTSQSCVCRTAVLLGHTLRSRSM